LPRRTLNLGILAHGDAGSTSLTRAVARRDRRGPASVDRDDVAVFVVSAVERARPHRRLLMRALERLRIPTLLYSSEVDGERATVEGLPGAVRVRRDR
jgi:translation elongation factor EF-G